MIGCYFCSFKDIYNNICFCFQYEAYLFQIEIHKYLSYSLSSGRSAEDSP